MIYEPVELRFDVGTLHATVEVGELAVLLAAAAARGAGPRLHVVVRPQLCDTQSAS